MKSIAVLLFLLLLTGCVRHARAPELSARRCAEGSYPYRAFYKGQLVTACAIPDPFCASKAKQTTQCPIAGFIGVGELNPVLDPDADEGAKDKGEKNHPWWKFWQKN